ncbi:MAG: hypothetical protein ACI8P0_005010 [Planctomycetaceae bacterium]|jgi:hypothetical protein
MDLREELNQLIESLNREQIPYALCGGMALAVHGHPRFTQDLDLLIQESDLQRLIEVAERLGYRDLSGWLRFNTGTDRETKLYRLLKPLGTESLILDLICVTSQFEDVWQGRTQFHLAGRPLTVVSRNGLRTMKQISNRVQDLVDLEKLNETPE